ncbi:hypothetical protein QQG55_2110 [Brugia pahangi]
MQSFTFFIFSLLANIHFAESVVCIPPSVPAKDNQGVECCRLPSEIFPHKVIYEEFCNTVYFGVMADGPNGRFCRLSGIQLRQSVECDSGWVKFFEGFNQFCYKAFSIKNETFDIANKAIGDPCENERKSARLVRIPNQSINMFLYVKVLNGAQNLSCFTTDENTYYYYIGLYRKDFDWRWYAYHEKAYSHLEEQAQILLDYLNSPRPKHVWSDGTEIFAKGWNDINDITTNVIISNCGMWRDVNNSRTNFKHGKKLVPNQGFICAYHV